MHGNSLTNQRLANIQWDHNQQFIRSEDYHNECIHQVIYKSCEQFLQKCMETKKSVTNKQMDGRTVEPPRLQSPTTPLAGAIKLENQHSARLLLR